jgi:uncharacterized protein involved in outer membrane biogenesis
MEPAPRLPLPGRITLLLLGAALGMAALFALLDWNWIARPLVRYLAAESGREIRVDHVDVELGLHPTFRLRGVYIANAPWASGGPFARAGEASFTVSLRSLWEGRPVVSRLVLVDADVDMERLADGRRNWRIRDPGKTSRGRVTVQALEAHRTRIRFVNRESDLDLVAVASPAPGEDKLTTRVTFRGTYEGVPFSGEAFNAGVVSFRRSGVTFPLRGWLVLRETRVEVDGFFTDVFDLGPLDAQVRVKGPTLSLLHPFFRIHPPQSRAFDLRAQVTQTNNVYQFANLAGKLGETDIAGEATFDKSRPRPVVRAQLRSASAHLQDLRPLVGLPSRRPRAAVAEERRVFPARPFNVEKLKAFDAQASLHAEKLTAPGLEMLESLRIDVALAGGALEVKPLRIGLAGGEALGAAVFDARQQPAHLRVDVDLRGVRLEKLLPRLADGARGTAPISGHVRLAGRADSMAGLLASASGSVSATMGRGRISNLADAKLALNIGKVLGLTLRGDRDIALHCGAFEVDVRNGTATSRRIVLDTEQTHTDGIGTLNLRTERWELVLTPQPRRPGLLTKDASIRLHGSFRDAHVSTQERLALRRTGQAASQTVGEGCDGRVTVAGERKTGTGRSVRE